MSTENLDSFFHELDQSLTEKAYAVFPDFFSRAFSEEVFEEISALRRENAFHSANVGKGSGVVHAPEIRSDGTCWFEPTSLSVTQSKLGAALEKVRHHLNETLFLGLWDWEGHYAIYPKGAFYQQHLDRFKNDSRRTVSVVFFFNFDWGPEDGGALRLILPEGPFEIAPNAGTAVFFLSDRIPHEVLETRRERFSFAGWFRTRV